MTDPKPQLILPVPPPYQRPKEAATPSSSQATPLPTAGVTTARVSTSVSVAEATQEEPPPGAQQEQRQQQGYPAERDWPTNVAVVRGSDQGLATGLFCPLCLGDLYQFLVTENRGFVMCPNRQCTYPFNLPREELQGHFTVLPKLDFGIGEEKGKEREV